MRAKETYCDEVEEMAKAYPFAMVDLDWNKLEFYIRNPEAAKMYNHRDEEAIIAIEPDYIKHFNAKAREIRMQERLPLMEVNRRQDQTTQDLIYQINHWYFGRDNISWEEAKRTEVKEMKRRVDSYIDIPASLWDGAKLWLAAKHWRLRKILKPKLRRVPVLTFVTEAHCYKAEKVINQMHVCPHLRDAERTHHLQWLENGKL